MQHAVQCRCRVVLAALVPSRCEAGPWRCSLQLSPPLLLLTRNIDAIGCDVMREGGGNAFCWCAATAGLRLLCYDLLFCCCSARLGSAQLGSAPRCAAVAGVDERTERSHPQRYLCLRLCLSLLQRSIRTISPLTPDPSPSFPPHPPLSHSDRQTAARPAPCTSAVRLTVRPSSSAFRDGRVVFGNDAQVAAQDGCAATGHAPQQEEQSDIDRQQADRDSAAAGEGRIGEDQVRIGAARQKFGQRHGNAGAHFVVGAGARGAHHRRKDVPERPGGGRRQSDLLRVARRDPRAQGHRAAVRSEVRKGVGGDARRQPVGEGAPAHSRKAQHPGATIQCQ